MKLIGFTRIRNEQDIIIDTLDHWSKICDGGIFIYDDFSTDKTIEKCRKHPAVRKIIQGTSWSLNRAEEEFKNRAAIFEEVKKISSPFDWLVYFDGDEFLYNFDKSILTNSIDAIKCKLFDVYITPEDLEKNYNERDFVGPEFREILFFFRSEVALGYMFPDQRECLLKENSKIIQHGIIKHFGKGFSVQQWEDTCEYYSKYFPIYAEKWEKRKGKAIHIKSDFDAELVRFSDILNGKEIGYLL